MPSIKDILTNELSHADRIWLYSEGIFWKAYQQSAYQLLKHCKVNYAVKRKWVKLVGCEVMSVGFPHTALSHLFKEEEIERVEEKILCVACSNVTTEEYTRWMNSLPANESGKSTMLPECDKMENKEERDEMTQSVMGRLKRFDVAVSTPI